MGISVRDDDASILRDVRDRPHGKVWDNGGADGPCPSEEPKIRIQKPERNVSETYNHRRSSQVTTHISSVETIRLLCKRGRRGMPHSNKRGEGQEADR